TATEDRFFACNSNSLSDRFRRLLWRDAIRVVNLRAVGSRHWTAQQRIIGRLHPTAEPLTHLVQHASIRRIRCKILMFSWIKDQIVEFFFGDGASLPSVFQPKILAETIVAVGQYRRFARIKMTNVLPS